jgi:hypothetical protein
MLHCCLAENYLVNEGDKFVAPVISPELRNLHDIIMKMVAEGIAGFCFLVIAVAFYLAYETYLNYWNHATRMNYWNLLIISFKKGFEPGLTSNSFVTFISGREGGFVNNTVDRGSLTHMGVALAIWQWVGIDLQAGSTSNSFRKLDF